MTSSFVESLTIIYAEDEFVFREIAMPAIVKAGVPRESIHVAEDGIEAMEHLNKLQAGGASGPLVMLLDVRMPGMDGNQVAQKVQEMVAQESLQSAPFMVCCSAHNREVAFDETGPFKITMPKPFGSKEVDLCLGKAEEWWLKSGGTLPAAGGGAGASSDFDARRLEIIVAGDEPVCRMAVTTQLEKLGVEEASMAEAEDEEEAVEALGKAQAGDAKRPLVLLLGRVAWAPAISAADTSKRKPYIINTQVEGDAASGEAFHAKLRQNFQQEDLKEALEKCWAWFHGA
mmetsp:Transcript_25251/g.79663  ORF Transcript_25251/g.79663 Transcript_25251/m.79663 type:complete len:287 (+) Transcript_25251:115-975(+)